MNSTIQKRLIVCLACCLLQACHQPTDTPSPSASPIQGAKIDSPLASPTSSPGVPGVKVAPTDPAERAKLAQEAPQPKAREGFQSVTFSLLSDFPYSTDKNGKLLPESKLPKEVSDLDQKQVAVSGFMVPIDFQDDKVSTLILVRNQLLCCYGEEPKLNEWVFVNIDPPVETVTEVPVTLFGKFYASPDIEEEQVISLYRMEATSMEKIE